MSIESTSPRKLIDDPFMDWMDIVEAYTRCALTKEKDKLPAIEGLVKIFERRGCGRYCAGLWENDFVHQLLWCVDDMRDNSAERPSIYRAPSWSWASLDGEVLFKPIEPDWEGTEKAMFGNVKNHCQQINTRGRCASRYVNLLVAGTTPKKRNDNSDYECWYARMEAPLSRNPEVLSNNTGICWIHWDEGKEGNDAQEYRRGSLQVCTLELYIILGETGSSQSILSLVLVPTSKAEFRRVGLCQLLLRNDFNLSYDYDVEGDDVEVMRWNYRRARCPLGTSNLPQEYYESTRTVSDSKWVDWRAQYEWETDDEESDTLVSEDPNGKHSFTNELRPTNPRAEPSSLNTSTWFVTHLDSVNTAGPIRKPWEPAKAKRSDTVANKAAPGSELPPKWKANGKKPRHGPQGPEVQLYTFTII
jgi:hypothetical protein